MASSLTKNTFEQNVLQAEVPVLVDFWAPWCGPCRALAPTLEEISQELAGKALVFKLNVDEEPELAAKYGVMNIPTVIAYKDGQVSGKLIGVRSKDDYQKLVL